MPEQSNQEYGKGYFLIANPVLPDPNFSRTVVLLCNHDDEGSFGLVINRSALINSKEVFKEMGMSGVSFRKNLCRWTGFAFTGFFSLSI